MRTILSVFAVMAVVAYNACGDGTKPSSESRTYDNAYDSHSTATATKTDNPYLKNEFQTGSISDADILLTRKINSLLFIQKCNVCLFCKYLI